MKRLQSTPLSLSTTPSGYSIVDSTDLTSVASRFVLLHISEATNHIFDSIESAAETVTLNNFSKFKDKPARIFPKLLAKQFVNYLESYGFLNVIDGDFVTDEEGLGYENIYWRLVRRNTASDVGPIHADRWFWELGKNLFPNSHARVKVWIPLIQDDENPSLMILPESHQKDFKYDCYVDPLGKKKPIFTDDSVSRAMVTAPVRVGEAIIFHDSLLHGGKVTDSYRVSLEFTLGTRVTREIINKHI